MRPSPTTTRRQLTLAAAVLKVAQERRLPPLTTMAFAKAFRDFSHDIPDFHGPWYSALDAALDGTGPQRLVLLAPREHAKTSVVLTFAVKAIADNRTIRIGIISSTGTVAQAFMRDITRELECNDRLIAASGGPFKPANPKKWDNQEIIVQGSNQAKDVTVFAMGAGSQVTGRHMDILILDDVETRDTVNTPELRAKTASWFSKEVMPTVSPGGIVIVIGTRKHYADLYSLLIPTDENPDTGWTVLDNALAAIDENGKPIWEEMWSYEALMARKRQLDAIDVLAWPQEYENRPLPSSTIMFRPQEWPEYDAVPKGCVHFQAWDLGISLKQMADFTAGADIAVDDDNNVYIVDVWFGHWDFNTQQTKFVAFWKEYGAQSVGIEAVAYQAAAVQEAARKSMIPVVALHSTQKHGANKGKSTIAKDKVARARLLEARAAVGKIYRPKGYRSWWPETAQQLAYFPSGAHDDIVDALAYVVTMAAKRIANFDDIYSIYRCKQEGCGNGYYLPEPKTRRCPRCGTPPDLTAVTDMYLDDAEEAG